MINMIPKHLRGKSGVYIIETIGGEPIYIGSTSRYSKRYFLHLSAMRTFTLWGIFEQYIRRYGHTNLLFKIYKECPISELRKEEKLAIEETQPLTNINWNQRNKKPKRSKYNKVIKEQVDLNALRISHLLKSYEIYLKNKPVIKRTDSEEWIKMMKHHLDGTEITYSITKNTTLKAA